MTKKAILVVNDDGIDSKGLEILAESALRFGDVFVVAPLEETSGVGKAITLGEVNVQRHPFRHGIKAYAIDGTPADAVLLGREYLLPREPDVILSGVNLGPNLGIEDFFDSGTIGAAIEGAIHRKLAIAFSLAISREQKTMGNYDITETQQVVERTLRAIFSNLAVFSPEEIISINVPYPIVNGIKASTISRKALHSVHYKTPAGYSMKPWEMTFYEADDENSDVHVTRDLGSASVTVVNLRLEDQFTKATRIASLV